MSRHTLICMVVLSCAALVSACDDAGPAPPAADGNTEFKLLISDPSMAEEELSVLVDFVSYRITCPDSGLTPYVDSVDLNGNFEANFSSDPPVWELVADLPPSLCTITLWVFYEDEVVCSGSETVTIIEDGDPMTMNKVDIILECSLSVEPPTGDADIDGTFNLVHGNYCPQVFWLGALPTVVGPTGVTNIQTSSFDMDNTCGQNCDPQTCDFTMNPPVCTPGPDPGLSSTLIAPAGNGTFGDPNALDTTYTCDLLAPGPTEICVLVSDGDLDCDQMRCVTIECPDLCAGVDCDDGNECTADSCDPLTGACSNINAPDGIACNDCDATCVAGACTGPAFTADQNAANMAFQGTLQSISRTFVNPYSGELFDVINTTLNLNTSSYKGVGTSDTLFGTNLGDVLLTQEPFGVQRICGVETIEGFAGFDLLMLADTYVMHGDMTIDGGNTNDVIWANAGDDIVFGNNGVDRIDGGPGNDTLDGGNAGDTFTLWPGSGFDSITGGDDGSTDTVEIFAIQSQIEITAAANPSYEFDILYLGTPMAEVREVERVVLGDGTIDLSACTGSAPDICNLCGNDALNGVEECDDGNNVDGDGCASDCTAEY